MQRVPSEAGRFRRFLSHAPWWIIATSVGATFLAITSVVHFQGEEGRRDPGFVLSAPRSPPAEKIQPAPADPEILPAPIPVEPQSLEAEEPSVLPYIPEDLEKFMISDRFETGEGQEEGATGELRRFPRFSAARKGASSPRSGSAAGAVWSGGTPTAARANPA